MVGVVALPERAQDALRDHLRDLGLLQEPRAALRAPRRLHVLGGGHLRQPRRRAVPRERLVHVRVEVTRRRGWFDTQFAVASPISARVGWRHRSREQARGRLRRDGQQLDLVLVQHVHEGDEAAHQVDAVHGHARHAFQAHSVEHGSDGGVVARPQRARARLVKGETRHASRRAVDPDAAAAHRHVHGHHPVVLGEARKARSEPRVRLRERLGVITRRHEPRPAARFAFLFARSAFTPAGAFVSRGVPREPVVPRAAHLVHRAPRLKRLDARHELRAVEPVFVQLRRRAVAGGHQRDAVGPEPVQQPPDDHRVRDVHHLELVQAQHGGVP